jgi:biopolymer transport protein ExbB/TolQ/ABC-type transporter Mla subunit MlaD
MLVKSVKMMGQRKVFRLTLIPPNLRSITSRNANYLVKNITQKVPRPKRKLLANRIILALHQFKNTGNIEQTSNILSYQAEIDLGSLEASYTMVNTFIWAVPILGFLGTVIGIGSAIGGFSGIIEEAVEIEAIKGALKVVTSGLATAFDTTLLGLISAMILMFISTPLRKMEEEFLTSIETFSIENLLNRMKGKIGAAVEEEEGEVITDRDTALKFKRIVEDAVDNCIKSLEGSFVSWKDGFSEVLDRMTSQTQELSEGFSSINPVVGTFQEIMNSFTTNMTKVSGEQNTIMETFSQEIRSVQPMVGELKSLTGNLAEERRLFLEQVDNWIASFDKSGQEILGKIENHNQQQYQSIQSIVQNLEQQRLTFDDGIGKWIQDFDSVGKNMFQATESTLQKIEEISDLFSGISSKYEETIRELSNTSNQLSASNETFRQTKDEITKLTDNQEQLMLMFNKSFEQQVTSDTLFRDTLVGIKNGLEAMYSPLEVLSRPKKISLVEE